MDGLSSYYSLKECFEKLTDLNFDDYITVLNYCSNEILYQPTRFIIFDRINQDPQDAAAIGHWCVYDSIKKLYYDPFGYLPPDFLEDVGPSGQAVAFNTRREQHINSNNCGYYCLKWIFLNMVDKLDTSGYKKMNDVINEYEFNNLMDLNKYYQDF